MVLRIGLIGCGLIGRRRAEIVHRSPAEELVSVADADPDKARLLAGEFGSTALADWRQVVARQDLDAVIVSTPNKFLVPIGVAALSAGKHLLCEKPPGRNANETSLLVAAARQAGRVLKIGFNHRHHPAIWKAHQVSREGGLGALLFVRAVYGHGGRPGYDKEWRGDPELSGGGELLDQGVHIVDLCRWFLGEFKEIYGFTPVYFWGADGAAPPAAFSVEDNAFALMRTPEGRVAEFHTSWTQWKNRFSFEVFGTEGYARVEGLGGSYGLESLTLGRRRPESGPPREERFEFPGPDPSWQLEWREFVSAIREARQPLAHGEDGLRSMQLIAAIYESARTGQAVTL
jgi:predicted dehydrogenase